MNERLDLIGQAIDDLPLWKARPEPVQTSVYMQNAIHQYMPRNPALKTDPFRTMLVESLGFFQENSWPALLLSPTRRAA